LSDLSKEQSIEQRQMSFILTDSVIQRIKSENLTCTELNLFKL